MNNPAFANVPEVLKKRKQWVLFRLIPRVGKKPTKIPYQISGVPASVSKGSNWAAFDAVVQRLEQGGFDGIGYVFSADDNCTGIDYDGCRNPLTGEIAGWALKWIEKFDSYTEVSPSGTGLHSIVIGKLPGRGRKNSQFEIYDQKRYFTISGEMVGSSSTVNERQGVIESFLAEVFEVKDVKKKEKKELEDAPLIGSRLSTNELKEVMSRIEAAKNGKKFSKLMQGDWEEDYKSQSQAEMALCSILDFYLPSNQVAIDQIVRTSGLYREKWDREDGYARKTIRKAKHFRDKTILDKMPSPSSEGEPDSPGALPLIHFDDIEEKNIEFLVQELLLKNAVAIISGLPGCLKSWAAEEIAVSVGSGQCAFGRFQAQKGKVIMFNAEDDPATITKKRLKGLAASKGLSAKDVDLHLINVSSLFIDDSDTQRKIEETLKEHRPDLVIFDPWRNVHTRDENDATEISTVLNYLRHLNKTYECSILLVCHDKKSTKGESVHRASLTRGSNALHGWRDSALYADEVKNTINTSQIMVYHRAAPAIAPFIIQLVVENVPVEGSETKQIKSAAISCMTREQLKTLGSLNFEDEVFAVIKEHGPLTRGSLQSKMRCGKQKVLGAVLSLLSSQKIGEVKLAGSRAKVLQVLEPPRTKP